jgi:hypothetical protein
MGPAGLQRNAVYLIRPDGYVAVADPQGRGTAITSYFDARKLALHTRGKRPKAQQNATK